MNNKKEKLREIINNVLKTHGKDQVNSINNEDLLRDDIGIDSLEMVDLVVKFEDEFGIDIFESGKISKVQEILDLM